MLGHDLPQRFNHARTWRDQGRTAKQTSDGETGLMHAVEQMDTSRDANGGWDHIETGKPRHFTGQQTGPPVVHDNDGIVDEKKCLQHGLRIAWTPPLRRGIENHRRTWRTNGTSKEARQAPSAQAPIAS